MSSPRPIYCANPPTLQYPGQIVSFRFVSFRSVPFDFFEKQCASTSIRRWAVDRAGYADIGPDCLIKLENLTITPPRWLRLVLWRLQPAGEAARTDIRLRCRLTCICIISMAWGRIP